MELKPCRKCGRKPVQFYLTHRFFVGCDVCSSEGVLEDTKEEAQAAWNRRTEQ